jgi:hypothetical protein
MNSQYAAVMTVLLVGERLQRCCDRKWDEVEEDEARKTPLFPCSAQPTAPASLTLDGTPLAGLEYTLPNELWLEILGMARLRDLHPAPGLDIHHVPITGPRRPTAHRGWETVAYRPHDVVVQAQSGTGKTASYAIAVLQNLDLAVRQCQGLVLCPVRELAYGVQKVFVALGDYMEGLDVLSCTGGTMMREDVRKLDAGVHAVVGTPGRVVDMIHRGALDITSMRQCVLDEADEMLSRGFKEQVDDILRLLPSTTQIIVLLSVATMPIDVIELTKRAKYDPIQIMVKKEQVNLEGIKQFYISVEREEWKLDTLCDLCEERIITQARLQLVFMLKTL